MKKRSRHYKYQITYFDPADPKGERMKTWRFKKRVNAKLWQADLKGFWREGDARQFPIRRITRRGRKR